MHGKIIMPYSGWLDIYFSSFQFNKFYIVEQYLVSKYIG